MKHAIFCAVVAAGLYACQPQGKNPYKEAVDQQAAVLKPRRAMVEIDSLNARLKEQITTGDRDAEIATAMRLADAYQFYAIDFPQDTLSAEFLLRRAGIYEKVFMDPHRAAELYEELYGKYEGSRQGRTALILAGSAYSDGGDSANAVRVLDRYLARFYDDPMAPQARQLKQFIMLGPEGQLKMLREGAAAAQQKPVQ